MKAKYFHARNECQLLTLIHVKSQFYAYLVSDSYSFRSCWWVSSLLFSSFEFRLRVSLASDGSLSLISRVRNINGKQFSFSFAYHTYFSVSDIRYAVLSLLFVTYSWILLRSVFQHFITSPTSCTFFCKNIVAVQISERHFVLCLHNMLRIAQ